MGDCFYIILDGIVGVRVPMKVEKDMNCAWDIYNYVLKDYKNIRLFKDEVSTDCARIIKCLGRVLLQNLDFKTVNDLVEFLQNCEQYD